MNTLTKVTSVEKLVDRGRHSSKEKASSPDIIISRDALLQDGGKDEKGKGTSKYCAAIIKRHILHNDFETWAEALQGSRRRSRDGGAAEGAIAWGRVGGGGTR